MSRPNMDLVIDSVYDFIKGRYPIAPPDDIKDVIRRHIEYGTCDIVFRGDKIVAVCRWNITNDRLVCDVLDLFIAPGESGIRVIKHIIARNWGRYLTVKYIRFARVLKYPNRKWRVYRIEDILHLTRREKHVRI